MANKKGKSFNSKKKTTTVSTAKKKSSTAKKKSVASNKTSVTKKKTTTSSASSKKKTTPKASSTKSTTKKVSPKVEKVELPKKKAEVKIKAEEPKKVEVPEEVIDLPKLKDKSKDVSKNTNNPDIVIKTEEYTVIKKEPIRYDGKSKKPPVVGKKRTKKSNAEKVAKSKKSNFSKKINKIKRKIKMYGINSVIPVKYIIPAVLIILLLIISPFIIGKIFKSVIPLDINSIPEKIDQLKTVSFNIDEVNDIITSSGAYDNLKDYYEYDFNGVFGLNSSYVDQYVIKYNKSKGQVFIAIKATAGHHDDIRNSIDKFLKDNKINDYDYLEYQDYQIYIKSNNNAIVISKIKQSQIRVFNILQDLKKEEIESVFKIEPSNYTEALAKVPMLRSDTCGYVIFKPSNAYSKEKIKNLMNDYYNGLETKWQNNEENKKLIQNRYFEEYQGYLIYLVSHDNNLALQLLKS